MDAIKGLLRGTFHFAHRHKLISMDPMSLVDINKSGCAAPTPKLSGDRIFLSHEVTLMKDMIGKELEISPHSTTALAIALLFLLGLRVGELVALRLSDIDWDSRTIHIHVEGTGRRERQSDCQPYQEEEPCWKQNPPTGRSRN